MTSSSPLQQARRAAIALVTIALFATACSTRLPIGPRTGSDVADAVRPATPDNPHRVALIAPLTGPDGGVATSIANAANLAIADTGTSTIRLTVYDSGRGGAAAAAARAIGEGNRLILGPLLSAEAQAVAPVARAASVPVIAFSNDSAAAGGGIFIMGVTPASAIDRVVRHARGNGAIRFAALVPANLYGERASIAVQSAVQRSGGALVGVQTYGATPASLRAAVAALRAKGKADAVLIADGARTAGTAAALLPAGTRILGTDLWAAEKAIGAHAGLRGAWFAALPNARFDQLTTRYRARFGKTPYRLGSLGYDSVLLTVRASDAWNAGTPFPARRLVDRDGFSGIDGIFRFARDGIADRALEVRQVTAAGSSVAAPAAASFENR